MTLTKRGNPRKQHGGAVRPQVTSQCRVAVGIMDQIELAPGRLSIYELLQLLTNGQPIAMSSN